MLFFSLIIIRRWHWHLCWPRRALANSAISPHRWTEFDNPYDCVSKEHGPLYTCMWWHLNCEWSASTDPGPCSVTRGAARRLPAREALGLRGVLTLWSLGRLRGPWRGNGWCWGQSPRTWSPESCSASWLAGRRTWRLTRGPWWRQFGVWCTFSCVWHLSCSNFWLRLLSYPSSSTSFRS